MALAGSLLLLVWGCSTTNHATLPTQAYHDLTSHYNAYFNSNEKMKGALQSQEASHKDKFDSVISVFVYSDPRDFASYSADMDDVIKRSTLAIQLHNIANWSDDHMLLIGRANYYKGDYDKAASSFKYITTEFKDGVDYVKVMKGLGKKLKKYVRAKKKKKKPTVKVVTNADGTKTLEKTSKRPKFSVWVHEPARAEALLWLIKTYTRQRKFDQAASVVTYVRSDDKFYQNLDPHLELTEADLKVTSKNYSGAIEPLENYLKHKKIKKKKRLKTRPLFVLAQCYEATGNYTKAIQNYQQVLKNRPNYDMEFYAKLKMAKLGRNTGGGNAAIKQLLAKMSRDGKYKDYYDQVYYEMALIAIKEGNRDDARKYLRKSVNFSIGNDDQKALSYWQMAELDYEEEAYVKAKFYYDSTLTFLAKNDPRYPEVEERNKMLENLVTQLNIIAEEDSLRQLAQLPESELKTALRDAAYKKELEEEAKKAEAANAQQQQQLNNFTNQNQPGAQQTAQQQGGANTSWYFYNATARAAGYNDFTKKWGRRKLEENWRRKNKNPTQADDIDPLLQAGVDTTQTDSSSALPTDATLEEKMMAALPTTPEKMKKSTERLIDAYYTAGTIYKDGLDAYTKAETTFETMNEKLPGHRLLLESYYNLYLIAQRLGNTAKAEKYKQLILSQYPESVIAKILRDPNYVNERRQKEDAVNAYYASAYNDYSSGNLDSAWYKSKMSNAVFKPNPLAPKFELLLALILAKQNRLNDYVQALNKIKATTTDLEVKDAATQLLARLNQSSLPQIDMSVDTARRDSLNALYAPPTPGSTGIAPGIVTPGTTTPGNITAAPQQANNAATNNTGNNTAAPVDTATLANTNNTTANNTTTTPTDTAKGPVAPAVVQEDTTSAYTRSDNAVHYFIVYIKDPAVTANAVVSTIAKLNAFNSTQFEAKRLQARQIIINSTNKLINVKQFKDRADAMEYYRAMKAQGHLYEDMQPNQYAITCISTINFGTLLTEKDIDAYMKYFNRVYK